MMTIVIFSDCFVSCCSSNTPIYDATNVHKKYECGAIYDFYQKSFMCSSFLSYNRIFYLSYTQRKSWKFHMLLLYYFFFARALDFMLSLKFFPLI